MMRKLLVGAVLLLGLVVVAFSVSPGPSILIVRAIFDGGAAEASLKLEAHVPPYISTTTLRYDDADPDASLDIHRPQGGAAGGPTIV